MFELPKLPYAVDALAPHISEATLTTHHGKHHAAYVKKTNALIEEKGWKPTALEDVVRRAAREKDKALFNQSAQAWNHGFFWQCLTPDGSGPGGTLVRAIERSFGAFDKFREQFLDQGEKHFASGWIWLVANADGGLALEDLHDAATPIVEDGKKPLLVCDLWEHAYYLDYKNERRRFLEAFVDELAHWEFAEQQYEAITASRDTWRYPESHASAG